MARSVRLPLTLDELLTQFRGLLDAHRAATIPARAGEGNLRCEGCLDCNRCRFCTQCVRCNDCSNCDGCYECRGCTRCRASRSCANSGNLEYCEGCEDSQYLVLCLDCTGCTQCFACVGLKGEEFCVLNQRYTRKDYFPVVQALKKRLEELIAAGHVLPDIAGAGRGQWPPRAAASAAPTTDSAPVESADGSAAASAESSPEAAAAASAESSPEAAASADSPVAASAETPPEPDVEPWLDDVAPVRGDGDAAVVRAVPVSWVPQPPRP